jgi:hypothetical protein
LIDELVAEAEIGEEARLFKQSDLGKTLLGMAEQDLLLAQEALELVDPTNVEDIRKLQNKAQLARNFQSWLDELIDRGTGAMVSWKQQNEDI